MEDNPGYHYILGSFDAMVGPPGNTKVRVGYPQHNRHSDIRSPRFSSPMVRSFSTRVILSSNTCTLGSKNRLFRYYTDLDRHIFFKFISTLHTLTFRNMQYQLKISYHRISLSTSYMHKTEINDGTVCLYFYAEQPRQLLMWCLDSSKPVYYY